MLNVIGTKIKVKPDYYCDSNRHRENNIGTIIGTEWNKELTVQDFWVKFPNGKLEPFAKHEFEVV